jgi:G:T-mismatch repair DNA endonuclease (very short patch repair protein)
LIGRDIYIIMDEKTKKIIISEYKKGKSSLQIVKIVNLSKQTILKVLNKHGLIRKRDRCKSLDIKSEKDGYSVVRKCPKCGKDIKTFAKDKAIACRNHFRKLKGSSLCKPCSLSLQVGEGNPFYGKKHSKETIVKISKILTENPTKFSSSSKPEKKILDILTNLKYDAKKTFRIDKYVCDIFVKKLNLIIEYNGDYWHCNPKKYHENFFHPHKKKTAKEIWVQDEIRIDNLKKLGYTLEVIWESDFDSSVTIQNIIKKYVKN